MLCIVGSTKLVQDFIAGYSYDELQARLGSGVQRKNEVEIPVFISNPLWFSALAGVGSIVMHEDVYTIELTKLEEVEVLMGKMDALESAQAGLDTSVYVISKKIKSDTCNVYFHIFLPIKVHFSPKYDKRNLYITAHCARMNCGHAQWDTRDSARQAA